MGIIAKIRGIFAPQKIGDLAALQHFMESRAAFLVQKSIMEYIQARSNTLFSTMMREPLFLAGYEKARWQSYPAAISVVAEMVEGHVRNGAGTAPGACDAAILKLIDNIVSRYATPSGLGTAFWAEASARAARDLAQASLGPPKQVQAIANLRAREIFEALPASPQMKQHDFDMFRNTIRFHLTEIAVEFDEKAEVAKLAAELAA
jgi:hypothetical protein